MGLCGHSFHVSKLFYLIFSLKFHISVQDGGGGGGGVEVEGDLNRV